MRTPVPLLLLTLTLTLLLGQVHVNAQDSHSQHNSRPLKLGAVNDDRMQNGHVDEEEFSDFCEVSAFERNAGRGVASEMRALECTALPAGAFQLEIDGIMIFSLIVCALWGALVRAIIHAFHITFPYTVILMLSGMLIGVISKRTCQYLHPYTAVARIPAKILLFTFLPLLIFESAFSIPVHTFSRSLVQILLMAFPGMILCTFITSIVTAHYFKEYNWTSNQGHLFGSLISATDPVAVVAILRELGVSEVLSVLIEGESLLNDGVALLLYEIFKELVEAEAKGEEAHSLGREIGHAILKFCQIAVGGPVLGWLMGKLTTFLLSNVYNDPPVEISATIVAAYLSYWLAEGMLGVSGVLAVLLLGLTLKAERTVISPDSQEAVHHFWGILGYLANTILFMIVGTVITETATNGIGWGDAANLLLLYVTLHFARFAALIVLYPLLKYFGYGMTWQNMIVMMWGGLRGAVGVSLALDIYRNEILCENQLLGAKMLFHTAGIVFLTLIINGPTTKPLLAALHLTDVSIGRKEDMKNAVKRIMRLKRQAVRMYMLSPKMLDADFATVDAYCTVTNPYAKTNLHLFNHQSEDKKAEEESGNEDGSGSSGKMNANEDEMSRRLIPPVPVDENATICPTCSTVVPNEPTTEEYEDLTEEGRLKVLRALKVSYTHRNSIGLTTDAALQVLMTDAERTEDKPLQLISVKSLERYTIPSGMIVKFDKKLKKMQHYLSSTAPQHRPPAQDWRKPFYVIVHKDYFQGFIILIIILNVPVIIWEIVLIEVQRNCEHENLFFYLNILFIFIFTMEALLDIVGNDLQWYFHDRWSNLDLFVLLLGYVDIFLDFFLTPGAMVNGQCDGHFAWIRFLRFTRILRAFRLFRSLLPALSALLDRKLDHQVFRGIDIARTFCVAVEDTIRYLPQMIENKRVLRVIWDHLERERWEAIHAIGQMELHYERIAIALKTRNACREVINTMNDTLHEMIDEGLLDQTEADILVRMLELKIKRLWHAPTSLEVKPFDREEELAYEAERLSLKAQESHQGHHGHHHSHDKDKDQVAASKERLRGVEFKADADGEGPERRERSASRDRGKDKDSEEQQQGWHLWGSDKEKQKEN